MITSVTRVMRSTSSRWCNTVKRCNIAAVTVDPSGVWGNQENVVTLQYQGVVDASIATDSRSEGRNGRKIAPSE